MTIYNELVEAIASNLRLSIRHANEPSYDNLAEDGKEFWRHYARIAVNTMADQGWLACSYVVRTKEALVAAQRRVQELENEDQMRKSEAARAIAARSAAFTKAIESMNKVINDLGKEILIKDGPRTYAVNPFDPRKDVY